MIYYPTADIDAGWDDLPMSLGDASCGDEPETERRVDGMFCNRCEEFVIMAEANQEDGTFRCWQCRQDWWR